jgi:arylsulfatase A-like enzyme
LSGNATSDGRLLYWTAPGFRARAVRDGDWKLIVQAAGGAEKVELFNVAEDPNETTNLAPRMVDRVAELQKKLADVSKADRDSLATD